MHCRLNHTLSSVYSIRGGQIQGDTNIACRIMDYKSVYYFFRGAYPICPPLPTTNHNQLWYTANEPWIAKKDIQGAKKTKCQRLPGDDIWLFSRVLQALIFPALHYAEKKNRSILSLSDCNVTSKMPVQYHQRLWREYCDDIGNFTLHTIPSDEVSCNFFMSLVPYWVSQQNASIFFLIQSISFK